jgi:threonine/homoserine/homoserine lactone efflux protein
LAALAMMVGALLWAGAALFGLQALFTRFDWLYLAFRIGGALYLLYLAMMLWRHARDPLPDIPAGLASRTTGWRGFSRALLLQLGNPKIMVFFGSIFLSLLPQNLPAWMDAAVLAIVAVNEFA